MYSFFRLEKVVNVSGTEKPFIHDNLQVIFRIKSGYFCDHSPQCRHIPDAAIVGFWYTGILEPSPKSMYRLI